MRMVATDEFFAAAADLADRPRSDDAAVLAKAATARAACAQARRAAEEAVEAWHDRYATLGAELIAIDAELAAWRAKGRLMDPITHAAAIAKAGRRR